MTDENRRTIELSRRTVLGSMGALGAASALGGAGTMAFFSDQENFTNNELVAGALDMKVDWQEHYSDWSPDENDDRLDIYGETEAESSENLDEDAADDFAVQMVDGGSVPSGHTGLPTHTDPLIAVPDEFVNDFMASTAVEAFPDANNDGIRDPIVDPCGPESNLGDTPEALSSDMRTNGTFAGQTTESGDPLINITDVKPGDFGELTLSFHLCDNDGFVWLNGKLRGNAENGMTEPERKDPDENGGEPGELADTLRAAIWYDGQESHDNNAPGGNVDLVNVPGLGAPGNNVFEPGEQLVVQGSLKQVLQLLSIGHGVPLDGDRSDPEPMVVFPETNVDGTFECRTEPGNPDCADLGLLRARKLETDEGDILEGVNTYQTSAGEVTLDVTFEDTNGSEPVSFTLEDSEFPISALIVKGGPNATVCESEEGATSSGETFTAPTNPNTGEPFGISHIDICFEVPDDGDDGNGFPPVRDRDCFEGSTTNYLGLAWWLPVDHGNEVQTDSVSFDLGLYTEQCRHNDGEGMVKTHVGDGFGKLEFPDREASWFARGRFGDNNGNSAQPYEVAVGTDPAASGQRDNAGHDWTEGQTEPFSLSYDGSTATFTVGENGDTATFGVGSIGPSGRFAVTAKAPPNGEIEVDDLILDGQPLEDHDGISAAGSSSAREVRHLRAKGADLQSGFTLSGTVTMVSFGDSQDEQPAFTISVD